MASAGDNHLKNLSLGRCGLATGANTNTIGEAAVSLLACNGASSNNIKLSNFSFNRTNTSLAGDTAIGPEETADYNAYLVMPLGNRWIARVGRLDNPNLASLFAWVGQFFESQTNMTFSNRGYVGRFTVDRNTTETDPGTIATLIYAPADISTDTSGFAFCTLAINVLGQAP
jgi:hypothetical protein